MEKSFTLMTKTVPQIVNALWFKLAALYDEACPCLPMPAVAISVAVNFWTVTGDTQEMKRCSGWLISSSRRLLLGMENLGQHPLDTKVYCGHFLPFGFQQWSYFSLKLLTPLFADRQLTEMAMELPIYFWKLGKVAFFLLPPKCSFIKSSCFLLWSADCAKYLCALGILSVLSWVYGSLV